MLNVIMWVAIYLLVGYPFALVAIRYDNLDNARLIEAQKNYPPERQFDYENMGPKGMIMTHLLWPAIAVIGFVWLIVKTFNKIRYRAGDATSGFIHRFYGVG